MITRPPSSAGGLNVTVICVPSAATDGVPGASGTVDGTAAGDGTDSGLVPSAFVASTVHVYVLPFVRLVTVIDVELASLPMVPSAPPLDDVHVAL